MTESFRSTARAHEGRFKEFCGDIFATLSRIDQRHAAQTYLYGLLNAPGRKSIRRLVAAAPGRSEQSLQQFINQSPWDPEPIRQRLLSHLVRELRPTAWVIEEVHFPKHGRFSAAVERQYVPSLGRVCNCQLAIAVTLTVEELAVPVNWRLMVPESWGRDEERRARARMPDHELPRPYWQYQLEVLDDMALEWGMPAAPVVVDTAHRGNVEPFLAGLELRRQPYLAQLSPTQRLWCDVTGVRSARAGAATGYPPGEPVPAWHGPVGQLADRAGNLARETVEWRRDHTSTLRSQFLHLPIRATLSDGMGGRPPGPAPQRVLLCEWPLGKPRPRGFWITNMVDQPLTELVALAKQRHLVGPRIEQFAGQYGLRDYEGRTFAGWHHHVTLATAAYTYRVLNDLRALADKAVESAFDMTWSA
ncbi:IS701 family transposase [Planosporangium sp. 12N6]|uniref:IS701 family transposase n=1 Tax=Planosporangium spinosum TaxID=3402278 RepID=UPI003CEF94B4